MDAFGKILAYTFSILMIGYFVITVRGLNQDDLAQTYLNSAVIEFVDDARSSGKITARSYTDLCYKVDTVVPLANIEIVHQAAYFVADEDGNINVHYYATVKEDILSAIYNGTGEYDMHNGDYLKVTVYNTEPSLGSKLMRVFSQRPDNYNVSLYVTYSGSIGNCPQ